MATIADILDQALHVIETLPNHKQRKWHMVHTLLTDTHAQATQLKDKMALRRIQDKSKTLLRCVEALKVDPVYQSSCPNGCECVTR